MEYRTLKLVLNFVKVLIVLLGAALTLLVFTGTNLVGPSDGVEFKEMVSEEVGYALKLAYWTGGICAGAAILFSIYRVVVEFKRSIPALIGVVLFLLVLFISYGMASPEMPVTVKEKMDLSNFQYQFFGGGVISIYIFLGLAVLTIVASEVRRIIIGSKA
jgi:hypothetical protein